MSPENEFFAGLSGYLVTPIDVSKFVTQYEEKLTSLKGKLTLLAGGPPIAWGRAHTDPRNLLVKGILKSLAYWNQEFC